MIEPSLQFCRFKLIVLQSFTVVLAMSGLLDSVAHFEARAQEVGLSDAAVRALRRHGLATLGKVAHAISMPGQAPSDESISSWMQQHMSGCTLGDQSAFRRLIWEGGALATADLRDQLSNPEAATNRKVPEAERARRRALASFAGPCRSFGEGKCLPLLGARDVYLSKLGGHA